MSDRLDELESELAKTFGRISKWRCLVFERRADTDADQIAIAEEVLAQPMSGGVSENHYWQNRLLKAKEIPEPQA